MNSGPRQLLLDAYRAALEVVNGAACVHRWLQAHPLAGPVHVIAIGKAACAMMRGALEEPGLRVADALIVTRRGHGEPLPWPVIEAGHPLPDPDSLAAGVALREYVDRLPGDASVLVLLSGGASALIEQLPDGLSLPDLQRVNAWLLASGLDIHGMNAVRKRLSCIKGGRLAAQLAPRPVVCLAISDVPGDAPASIGSGPLSPDDSVLPEGLPPFLQSMLAQAPPMPAVTDECFRRLRFEIVARNADARRAAARVCEQAGYRTNIVDGLLGGDAVANGQRLAEDLLAGAPGFVQVWGGETTVVLPPHPGRGGRCQTLALAAARRLAGPTPAWLLAAGTDGSDGPGEDAGALVDQDTVARGETEGLDAEAALAAADAGTFLEASGDLLQTGPTGTNVMDLVIGLRL